MKRSDKLVYVLIAVVILVIFFLVAYGGSGIGVYGSHARAKMQRSEASSPS